MVRTDDVVQGDTLSMEDPVKNRIHMQPIPLKNSRSNNRHHIFSPILQASSECAAAEKQIRIYYRGCPTYFFYFFFILRQCCIKKQKKLLTFALTAIPVLTLLAVSPFSVHFLFLKMARNCCSQSVAAAVLRHAQEQEANRDWGQPL